MLYLGTETSKERIEKLGFDTSIVDQVSLYCSNCNRGSDPDWDGRCEDCNDIHTFEGRMKCKCGKFISEEGCEYLQAYHIRANEFVCEECMDIMLSGRRANI
jgi:hypothetical protein